MLPVVVNNGRALHSYTLWVFKLMNWNIVNMHVNVTMGE